MSILLRLRVINNTKRRNHFCRAP